MRSVTHVDVAGLSGEEVDAAVGAALVAADVVSLSWPDLCGVLGIAGASSIARVAAWADARYPGRWGFRGDLLFVDAVRI